MIILHTSDLHFHRSWFRWLIESAPEHDLLVISGDLLAHQSPTSLQAQARWVAKWLRAYARPVVLCSGWQDLQWDPHDELWTPAYWLRSLSGTQVMVEGQRVSIDGVRIHSIAATASSKGALADLWVVHAPPAGTKTARRKNGHDGGDRPLANAVKLYEPRWVLCGRVHDPIAWSAQHGPTLVLNPGRNPEGRFPNHIVLNTNTGAVCHVADHGLPASDVVTTSENNELISFPTPSVSTASASWPIPF